MKIESKISSMINNAIFDATLEQDSETGGTLFNVVDYNGDQVIDYDSNVIVGEG